MIHMMSGAFQVIQIELDGLRDLVKSIEDNTSTPKEIVEMLKERGVNHLRLINENLDCIEERIVKLEQRLDDVSNRLQLEKNLTRALHKIYDPNSIIDLPMTQGPKIDQEMEE